MNIKLYIITFLFILINHMIGKCQNKNVGFGYVNIDKTLWENQYNDFINDSSISGVLYVQESKFENDFFSLVFDRSESYIVQSRISKEYSDKNEKESRTVVKLSQKEMCLFDSLISFCKINVGNESFDLCKTENLGFTILEYNTNEYNEYFFVKKNNNVFCSIVALNCSFKDIDDDSLLQIAPTNKILDFFSIY